MTNEEHEVDAIEQDGLRDYVCRCEEVTRSAIDQAISEGNVTLDDIKRRTRAGMGPCQGIFCLRTIAFILHESGKFEIESLEPMTARPPARLITLGSLAAVSPNET